MSRLVSRAILPCLAASALLATAHAQWTETRILRRQMGVPDDWYGWSVAVSGDTIVVGARLVDINGIRNQGAAFVYERQPGEPWSAAVQVAQLRVRFPQIGDQFGQDVAIEGDTIVVGAKNAMIGTNDQQGAAYIYRKPATGWRDMTETVRLFRQGGKPGDFFGESVDISNQVVVVGATNAEFEGARTGAVFVYFPPQNGGWGSGDSDSTRIQLADGQAGDQLGRSVAIQGSIIIAGARETNEGRGAVYIFDRETTNWAGKAVAPPELIASDGERSDSFGIDIDIDRDTIVVGALNDDDGAENSGAVYTYQRPPGGWVDATESAKMRSSVPQDWAQLGGSVAIAGDSLMAGARLEDVNGKTNVGVAYVFRRPLGGQWASAFEDEWLTGSIERGNDRFGIDVFMEGRTAVIGAFQFAGGRHGVAYVFEDMVSPPDPVYREPILRGPTSIAHGSSSWYEVRGQAGQHALLLASPSAAPSRVPGAFELGIGNDFAALTTAGGTDLGTGIARVRAPAIPGASGTWFWQALLYDPDHLDAGFAVTGVLPTTMVPGTQLVK